ncbi:heme o synthase [Thorsellia kenyensis]|uniref:Protoheme IX farnesyltransferase n=1 Tax=Thorsellia kenyensis TaxID=1549888 RepID=A0ABV6C9P8_9GAMM
MLKAYIQLTKPGIIFGNLIAVFGGFFLATREAYPFLLFFWSILGVALIIAGGCVANNLIDRDIDALMKRTSMRATVTGEISLIAGSFYSVILTIAGLLVLFYFVNPLSGLLGLLGLLVYVGFYSLYFKRNSIYGTLIGSVSGAVPPVIGYVAVTNHFDLSALILLLMFSVWQMPHAYAIALNRFEDYKVAKIPVLPHVKGLKRTQVECLIYCFIFLLLSTALGLIEQKRLAYTFVAFILSVYWLFLAFKLFKIPSSNTTFQDQMPLTLCYQRASKKLFYFSIILITLSSLAMAIPY